MKQTAVEWLYDQLEFDESVSMDDIEEVFKQAKQMEKEHIKNEREEAYNNGYANGQMDAYTN